METNPPVSQMTDTNRDDPSVPISPSLSKELHDLNITLTRKKPWWSENGSLVVATMALILSLFVAGISALTSYNKDIHDQQIQLATVTEQIADLEIKAVELAAKYKDDQVTQVQINDLLFAQHATLLQDAGDIATRLGTNSTSAALITIAQRDLNLGSIEEAHRLLLLALSAARTPVDTWAAMRNLGFVEIRYATSPEMREKGENRYHDALKLADEKQYAEALTLKGAIELFKANTEADWANALSTVDCSDAQKHFSSTRQYLSKLPDGVADQRLNKVVTASEAQGIGGIRSCLPGPEARGNEAVQSPERGPQVEAALPGVKP